MIRSYRDLEAWQAGMDLAIESHRIAAKLPVVHRFEIGSHIRKAATSIPSNVAEGQAYRQDKVFLRHVRIAQGSLAELETQIEIVVRLVAVRSEDVAGVEPMLIRSEQLLNGLARKLQERIRAAETSRRTCSSELGQRSTDGGQR